MIGMYRIDAIDAIDVWVILFERYINKWEYENINEQGKRALNIS